MPGLSYPGGFYPGGESLPEGGRSGLASSTGLDFTTSAALAFRGGQPSGSAKLVFATKAALASTQPQSIPNPPTDAKFTPYVVTAHIVGRETTPAIVRRQTTVVVTGG